MAENDTQIRVLPDKSALIQSAAESIISSASIAISDRGQFHFVLSGGGTPGPLYQYLAHPQRIELISWERTHVYWGDERCVLPDEEGSNYKQAKTLLLDHVPISPANVHRMKGELSPSEAAVDYANQLERLGHGAKKWPRFDAVLMGMGDDGHTASLFPGNLPEDHEYKSTLAITANYDDRPANRVTLTPQVFNSARLILFLVVGKSKAQAVKTVISGPSAPHEWPAQLIHPQDGRVIWFLDEAAAGDLAI